MSAHDQSLIRRDTAIPGLAQLLDSQKLASLLANGNGIHGLKNVAVDYLRYKPGLNCIARFAFVFEGQRHFGYAKAFGNNADVKLGKAGERTACDSPAGPGRVVFEQAQILVCLLPNDQRLRSLCKLVEPRKRDEFLSRIFKGDNRWRSATFEGLNYKPERRFVARFTNSGGQRAAVKFYTPGEFEQIRKFRKRLRDPGQVQIPAWIGGSKAHQALAYSWLPGSSLALQGIGENLDTVAAAGAAIAHFHAAEQPGLRRAKAGVATRRLQALAQELACLMPESEQPARQLAESLAGWWMFQENEPRVPIHGDFYHRQVIAGEKGVALIDSDDAQIGIALSDIANFVAHLERAAIDSNVSAGLIPAVTEALCSGYHQVRPEQDMDGLGRHTALALYQLLHNPFRARSRDWPGQTKALMQRCSELMIRG